MSDYFVVGDGPYGVESEEDGRLVYDLLDTRQEATDIAVVLNAGVDEDWHSVEAALAELIVVKTLPAGAVKERYVHP